MAIIFSKKKFSFFYQQKISKLKLRIFKVLLKCIGSKIDFGNNNPENFCFNEDATYSISYLTCKAARLFLGTNKHFYQKTQSIFFVYNV